MKFEFTQHARERCRERNIRYRDIRSVIQNPDTTRMSPSGAIEAKGKIRSQTLVVVFEVERAIRKIITAYYEI